MDVPAAVVPPSCCEPGGGEESPAGWEPPGKRGWRQHHPLAAVCALWDGRGSRCWGLPGPAGQRGARAGNQHVWLCWDPLLPGLRREESDSLLPARQLARSPACSAVPRTGAPAALGPAAGQEKPVTSFLLSVVLESHRVLPPKCIFLSEVHLVSITVTTPLVVFQSKEIGLQMHEELLKVTNELYTVSAELVLPRTHHITVSLRRCPGHGPLGSLVSSALRGASRPVRCHWCHCQALVASGCWLD